MYCRASRHKAPGCALLECVAVHSAYAFAPADYRKKARRNSLWQLRASQVYARTEVGLWILR
jgi:hypothetical protein